MVAPEPLFLDFFELLKAYGLPLSMQYLMDFYTGVKKGLVRNLDELFVFARLSFVKKTEHMDAFERAFALYFFDIDIPDVAPGDPALFNTYQFQEWLKDAIERKEIPLHFWNLPQDELIRKFWETIQQQLERHDGGTKWVGTGGSSPFGHSGAPQPGVRVHGPGGNRSAIKSIGERHYIDYAASHALSGSNIRQALASLKELKPSGAYNTLDMDETIYQTAKNGGEIELVFQRDLRDKISVILLIDNGGTSMLPFVQLTRMLFDKLSDRFKTLKTYFFHNTIYANVYTDPQRTEAFATEKLLQASPNTRLIIVGDASMGPGELLHQYGDMDFYNEDMTPSIEWLQRLQTRFKHSVWLNPILSEHWNSTYGAWTLLRIKEIFQMEELSLKGIKSAVEHLNR